MEIIKNIIKNGFIKIISGALLGIGFGLTFIIISMYATHLFSKKLEKSPQMMFDETSNISGIEFIDHKNILDSKKLLIMGSLVNNNKKTIKSITLEAEFFKNGKFVDECTDYTNVNLKTGETENFKVACGGCNDYDPPEYDTYTLVVKSTH